MQGLCMGLALLLANAPALATGESDHGLSGALGFTTDYLYRGVSRTDASPAGQGRLEYSYRPWGIYLGAWASNVDEDTSDGEVEIDWMGGMCGSLTGLDWDLGAIYYHFPGDDLDPEKDYVEAKFGLSYGLAVIPLSPRASVTVYYSPDFYFETGESVYTDAGLALTLPFDLVLGLHIGYQYAGEVDVADLDLDDDTAEDYIDWRVGVSKALSGFVLDVSYWDAGDEESFCAGPGSENCRGSVVGTVTWRF